MADVKISALPAAVALTGSEVLPGVQGGATVRITPAQLQAWLLGGPAGVEMVQDVIGGLVGAGGGIAVSYNDAANSLTIAATNPKVIAAATDPSATADAAAGYAVGSGWLNNATGVRWTCLDATAGAAAWSPVGVFDHPGYVSGRTYPAAHGVRSTTAATADTLCACRIGIRQRVAITGLACFVSTAATGSMRLGLYANAGGGPGAKLAEAASTPSTGTAGAISAALATPITLNPGVYWLASLFSAGPSMICIAASDVTQTEYLGSATVTGAFSASTQGIVGLQGSGATYAGGLPTTFGAATPRFNLSTPLLGVVVA